MVPLSEVPIIQAPMAGGSSTPALTAAVNRAGGYGFVAAGYLHPAQLHQAIAATCDLCGGPFGVNLFVPSTPTEAVDTSAYADSLRSESERLGVALGDPHWDDDDFDAKVEVVEAARVPLVSFTFGCPTTETIDRIHTADGQVAVTVTSADEARWAEASGADLLVVQGTEAGGHQGSFIDLGINARPLLSLLVELRETVAVPLIGSGGIMNGLDARLAIEAGAVAVQLGTAFLCTPEAGTSSPHRRALLGEQYPDTMVTRAYTGRFGRGLANEFALAHDRTAPAAYPQVHHLTRPLRIAAIRADDASVPNLWAGTGWRRITTDPASVIFDRIAAEAGSGR